jgi:hypothetical protein
MILTTGLPQHLYPVNKGSQIVDSIEETKYGTDHYN